MRATTTLFSQANRRNFELQEIPGQTADGPVHKNQVRPFGSANAHEKVGI